MASITNSELPARQNLHEIFIRTPLALYENNYNENIFFSLPTKPISRTQAYGEPFKLSATKNSIYRAIDLVWKYQTAQIFFVP